MSEKILPAYLEGRIVGPFTDYVPPSWDVLCMRIAYDASEKSKDPKTKIGAFIVGPDHEPISFGYNGMPRGVEDTFERLQRPLKYQFIEHAERNAIFSVPRIGGPSLKGSIMFTHGLPCCDCGRAVIQAGIKTVVTHKPWEDFFAYFYDNWKESCEVSRIMFAEAGIEWRQMDEFVGRDGYINGTQFRV